MALASPAIEPQLPCLTVHGASGGGQLHEAGESSRVPRGGLGGQLVLAPSCLSAAVPLISRATVFLVSMGSWRCFKISYLLTTVWLCDYGPAWSLSLHAMSLLCAALQSSEPQEALTGPRLQCGLAHRGDGQDLGD